MPDASVWLARKGKGKGKRSAKVHLAPHPHLSAPKEECLRPLHQRLSSRVRGLRIQFPSICMKTPSLLSVVVIVGSLSVSAGCPGSEG